MTDNSFNKTKLLCDINEVFTPQSPIEDINIFAGRSDQINLIIDSINRRGSHVVLYGERGVGKTSLSNIIPAILKLKAGNNYKANILKVTCDRSDDFKKIWSKLFEQIRDNVKNNENMTTVADSDLEGSFKDYLGDTDEEVDVHKIYKILQMMQINNIFVIDEFDTIQDEKTKEMFADLIKCLSDNKIITTIILVGVSTTINQLIGNHPSIERNLSQIQLPRMSKDELGEIIDKGLSKIGMTIEEEAKSEIIDMSGGFPHYTHLLSNYAAIKTVQKESTKIFIQEFNLSIEKALENANQSIREAYKSASRKGNKEKIDFEKVIFACEISNRDSYEEFTTRSIQDNLSRLIGRKVIPREYRYYLNQLCDNQRGKILSKEKKGVAYKYRFNNPLLKIYIGMKYKEFKNKQKFNYTPDAN